MWHVWNAKFFFCCLQFNEWMNWIHVCLRVCMVLFLLLIFIPFCVLFFLFFSPDVLCVVVLSYENATVMYKERWRCLISSAFFFRVEGLYAMYTYACVRWKLGVKRYILILYIFCTENFWMKRSALHTENDIYCCWTSTFLSTSSNCYYYHTIKCAWFLVQWSTFYIYFMLLTQADCWVCFHFRFTFE